MRVHNAPNWKIIRRCIHYKARRLRISKWYNYTFYNLKMRSKQTHITASSLHKRQNTQFQERNKKIKWIKQQHRRRLQQHKQQQILVWEYYIRLSDCYELSHIPNKLCTKKMPAKKAFKFHNDVSINEDIPKLLNRCHILTFDTHFFRWTTKISMRKIINFPSPIGKFEINPKVYRKKGRYVCQAHQMTVDSS